MILMVFKWLFQLHGWRVHHTTPKESYNCVMIAAPHTSNWDFVYALAALKMLGINGRVTVKKEMNKFILGRILESMGALWIDRNPKPENKQKRSMVFEMVELFKNPANVPMAMLVTAEGTRSAVKNWKTGFYHVALRADVPICLAFLDFKTKVAGVGLCFKPSGDIDADMRLIMNFYKDQQGKYPEQFVLDERYV